MKRYVLNISDLQDIAPQFKSESGTKILKYLFNLCKINEINALYDRSCDYRGAAFCNSIIDDLDITCQIDHEEKLDNLPEGAFITVSNHPFERSMALFSLNYSPIAAPITKSWSIGY